MSTPTILHCIPTMGGGGAERQLTYLAGELGRLGWAVHVAVGRRGPNWGRLEASGAVIHELALPSPYDPRALRTLRQLTRDVRADLVQAWLLQMEVLGGLAALTTGTPWIFSERSSARAYPPTLKNWVRQRMARRADAIICNSAGGDDYWRTRAPAGPRRFVIPNGIPLAEIDATLSAPVAAMGSQADRPVVLFAGRFEPEKNVATLLTAFERVLTRHNAHLCCCGDGALKQAFDGWVRARGPEGRAMVIGHSSNLWGLMKGATVLVSPSLFEGSPNVVLEAMACGVPLVLSDIPQHRELVDESAAILVPPQSAEALADAIVVVLRDPAAAAARARVARARAAQYSVTTVAHRYDDVYRHILAGKAGA